MEEIKKELVDFDEAFDSLLYYDKKALDESIAIDENNEKIIIRMLEKNYSISEIKDIMGYTEKEIERIWEGHLLEGAMEKNDGSVYELIREFIKKHPGAEYESFIEVITHFNPQEIEAILNEKPKTKLGIYFSSIFSFIILSSLMAIS